MKAADAARAVKELVNREDLANSNQYIFKFSDSLRSAEGEADEIEAMTLEEPVLTGYPFFDAAVAALSHRYLEYVGRPIPEWVWETTRYVEPTGLGPWWSVYADEVHPTLLQHGVILIESSLETKREAARRTAAQRAESYPED
jgi:hypothetical protein